MREIPRIQCLLVLLALSVLASGCVRRRLTVRTNPAGASVYVDKQPIGTSPISTPFTYYGTREIEVVGDGFRTEKVLREISPPWYQLPPLDFISETLWPWEIRDERIIDITLVRDQPPSSEDLRARGENLRLQASQGFATPLPPTLPPGSDFRSETVVPGNTLPARPLDPTFAPGTVPPVVSQSGPPIWQPGQIIGNFLAPGGQPPQRIPEAGILPGGGYRPEISE